MISYAQNREDVVLARAFSGIDAGFYIDIGAADPISHSVTKHFYDLGWTGINIEPAEHYYEALRKERSRDVNLNLGISDREGVLPFYQASRDHLGESTFSADDAERHRLAGLQLQEIQAAVTTLARVCEEHVGKKTIDLLKIDVEGHERQAIEGANWKSWRPRVVVVEATHPNTNIPSHKEWEQLLLEAEYEFALFDGLNRFYVAAGERRLRSLIAVPSNVFDDFAPYEFVKQIEERDIQLARTRAKHEESQREMLAEIDERAATIDALSSELRKQAGALNATRSRLQTSESIIRDLRIELAATQAACTRMSEDLAGTTQGRALDL